MNKNIFITGGTGYIGSRLIPKLAERGYIVKALIRKGSESKLAANCEKITGDALDYKTFINEVAPAETFIHLIGVSHPGPQKAKLFKSIDLESIKQSVKAASETGIKNFIYLSAAQPAPVMKEYVEVRADGEKLIRDAGLRGSIIRPWYVLGPGHYWPYVMLPVYKILELIPATRESALRLGLITIQQMLYALILLRRKTSRQNKSLSRTGNKET